MIQPRFPNGNFIVQHFRELIVRQKPERRWIGSAVLLRLNEIFRCAVNGEVECGLGGKRFDSARRTGVRIFYDKIEVRLFVHIIEKRKRGGKDKDADGWRCAQADNDPAKFWLPKLRHDRSDV